MFANYSGSTAIPGSLVAWPSNPSGDETIQTDLNSSTTLNGWVTSNSGTSGAHNGVTWMKGTSSSQVVITGQLIFIELKMVIIATKLTLGLLGPVANLLQQKQLILKLLLKNLASLDWLGDAS